MHNIRYYIMHCTRDRAHARGGGKSVRKDVFEQYASLYFKRLYVHINAVYVHTPSSSYDSKHAVKTLTTISHGNAFSTSICMHNICILYIYMCSRCRTGVVRVYYVNTDLFIFFFPVLLYKSSAAGVLDETLYRIAYSILINLPPRGRG